MNILRIPIIATVAMSSLMLCAANYNVNTGGALPSSASIATDDTITLLGNPGTLTAAYNLNNNNVTFQSDTVGVFRTVANNGSSRIFDSKDGITESFNYIILTGANLAGAQDGGAIRITGGTGPVSTLNGVFIVRSNTIGRYGGGVSSQNSSLVFGNDVTFESNVAGQRGGGVYATSGTELTFKGNAIFTSNTAGTSGTGGGGGAVYSGAVGAAVTFGTNATFRNNATVLSNGGAIYSAGDLVFNGNAYFEGNQATAGGGGAIFSGSGKILTFKAGVTATANIAGTTSNGGALYTRGDVYISGNSYFYGNKAGGDGGAIYMYSDAPTMTATLDATIGDIVFQGNQAKVALVATATANAINIRTSATTSPVMVFNTGTGGSANTIYFYDPIAGSSVNSSATINQIGNGTLVFNQYQSSINTIATIQSGTFKLTNGAIFGSGSPGNGAGSFTLNPQSTLSANGTIQTGTMTIKAGSTIEGLGGVLKIDASGARNYDAGINFRGSGIIDMGAAITASSISVGTLTPDNPVVPVASATNTAQTLTFANSTPLTIATGGTIAIDMFGGTSSDQLIVNTLSFASGSAILNLVGTSGTYTVVTANNSNFTAGNFNILVNNTTPTARYGASSIINSINSGAGSQLVIDFGQKNLAMTWAGTPGSLWKNAASTDGNWTDGGANPEKYFVNGDSVLFNDTAANKNVTIDAGGVTVAHMTVDNSAGNDYTFAGNGAITSSTTATMGSVVTPTGKLVKTGAGSLNFANTAANNFIEGIEISGGTIGFTADNQLGEGGNGIHFTDDAALRANANNLTLTKKLVVDAGKTATLDTNTYTLTYAGDLSGVDAAATLAKSGSGTLKLTNDYSTYTSTLAVQQGNLSLDTAAAKLGGTINIASGAKLSGIGTATGSVNTVPGSIIDIGQAGATTAQTLTINNLSLNASTVRFDLFTGNTNDKLNITGALATAGANIIDISAFTTGTYNLGNIASLSTAQVTIGGVAQVAGARQTATLSTSGLDLLLIAGADISRILYWTGSTSALWNPSDANWTDNGTVNLFAGGDRVIFDGVADAANPANRTVNIQGTGITVSDMQVQGSANYTFAGAGITSDAASVISGTLTGAMGKLVKAGSGTLALTNAANTFKGGIELAGGALTFTAANQLGDGGNGIHFTGDATLASATTGLTLANNLLVDAGKTGTIDTGTGSLTLSGTLNAAAATGTLAKAGTGTLTLTGNSSAATNLATNVNAGSLLLNNATLGGVINVAANSVFGGVGTASGTVKTAAGSLVQVGLPSVTSGTLNIANLQLANSSTLTALGNSTLTGAATLTGTSIANIAGGNSLTLTGTNTGAGKLIKTGSGNLIYNSVLSLGYTGGTQIDSGFVLFRGITGSNTTLVNQTVTLNGGWLDLSDSTFDTTGSTANNWSGLTIIQGTNAATGGVIGSNDAIKIGGGTTGFAIGSGTKTGVFVVVSASNGTAVLTGSNAYKGYTRIDSGVLKVTAGNQLGDIASTREVILNGGSLQISGSFDTQRAIELRTSGTVTTDANAGGTWGAINKNSGTAAANFTKDGAGTLTITNANAASTTTVAAGKYVALKNTGAGAGLVTVANGATFEFRTTGSSTATNNVTGAGTLAVTSGNLTLSGTSIDIAKIAISNNAIVTTGSTVSLFGSASTALSIDAARLNLGAPSTALGNVTLSNGGVIGFTTTAGIYKQATLAGLTGSGTLALNANLGLGLSDSYRITAAPTGSYVISVNNTGGTPTGLTNPMTLVTAPTNSATFALAGGHLDVGNYSYLLDTQSSGGSTAYQLISRGELSNVSNYIYDAAAATPMSWFSELDNLQKRMGELHDGTGSTSKVQTWMRANLQRFDVTAHATGSPFHETQTGLDAGADYSMRGETVQTFVGGYIGYAQADRNVDGITGSNKSDNLYGGIYGTLVTENGWYVDGLLKVNGFKNKFSVLATSGDTISADYTTYAFGGSLEVGKSIGLGKGWFVAPRLQGSYVAMSGKDYTTSMGNQVELDWGTTAQALAGVRFGRTFKTGFGEFFQPYLNFFGASQWTTDGHLNIDGEHFSPGIKGDRIGGGAGLNWMPTKSTQIYVDFECAKAHDYDKPYGFSFGVRHMW